MHSLFRDFLLSFSPAAVRRALRPESTLRVLQAATWSGLAQFLLAGLVLIVLLKNYFAVRGHQLAPHISGSNETGQAIIAVIVALEFLLHPLSLFLLYLAIEGLIRFIGGLITSEVVPNLLVFLFSKAYDVLSRARGRRQIAPLLADFLDHLPEGRIRIASACRKSGWNASITIGLSGQWFEIEREEHGPPPRPFVCILRPLPLGKVLRGYEEYDASSALSASGTKDMRPNENVP
jgi:hypothetical protein